MDLTKEVKAEILSVIMTKSHAVIELMLSQVTRSICLILHPDRRS